MKLKHTDLKEGMRVNTRKPSRHPMWLEATVGTTTADNVELIGNVGGMEIHIMCRKMPDGSVQDGTGNEIELESA